MTSIKNNLNIQDVINSILFKSRTKSSLIHIKRLVTIRGTFIPGELWEDIRKYYLTKELFIINKPNNISVINTYNDIPNNTNKIKLFENNKLKLGT